MSHREAWRDRKRREESRRREAGQRRVAVWISEAAYASLVIAQDRHLTTASEEIEAAIHLNRRMRVRERSR